ncbi:MAG TPA: gamma-glutamyl-gamma-aminobutyrate hydrolase family protein [Streptosporangiaceae bacterium]|jgi:putative glutamine amidotransferase
MTVPLIGISAYCERARWGVWDVEAMVLPRRYADRVAQAGGIPVLLPPAAGIEDAAARLDGLVLSGGGDIDPARYGAAASPHTTSVNTARDAAELALLQAALDRGLPVLGICRGMQLINVALGGSLHQHLPDVVGHAGHSPRPGAFGDHDVTLAPGSRVAQIIGAAGPGRPVSVPTHHHQGVNRLGVGLTAAAWAADGTIEAAELDQAESRFVLAVQWHPEAGNDLSLFRALVAAAGQDGQAGRDGQDSAPPATETVPARA